MIIDNFFGILSIVVSLFLGLLSATISIVSMMVSFCAQSKANSISATANKMIMGQNEMQIREMISNAKREYMELALTKCNDKTSDMFVFLERVALESVLNAYDEACAKYIDGKIDRKRFKTMYLREIQQVVDQFSCEIDGFESKYPAILHVNEEWKV